MIQSALRTADTLLRSNAKKVKSGIGGGTSSAINRLPIAAFLPYTFYKP
jgi:hypothetical protein